MVLLLTFAYFETPDKLERSIRQIEQIDCLVQEFKHRLSTDLPDTSDDEIRTRLESLITFLQERRSLDKRETGYLFFFDDLTIALLPLFLYIVHRVLGNTRNAEDVIQEALTRAWKALQDPKTKFTNIYALKAWLCRIVHHTAINQAEREDRFVSLNMVSSWLTEQPGRQFEQPEVIVMHNQTVDMLNTALAKLPPLQRQILVMRYIEGYKLSEIAQILKRPLGTIKVNNARGLATMRRRLKQSNST